MKIIPGGMVRKKFYDSILILFFIFCLFFPALAFPEITSDIPGFRGLTIDLRSKGYYTQILGNSAQSFLTPGLNYEDNLYLRDKEKLSDTLSLKWDVQTRFTDDPRINHRNVHIEKIYFNLQEKDKFDIEFGDVSTSFSRYSLGRTIEGLDLWNKFDFSKKDYFKTNVVAGRIWRARRPTRYARYLAGGRAELGIDKMTMGFNLMHTRDDSGSIDTDDLSLSARTNWVYSADWGLKKINLGDFRNINIEQELAISRYDPDQKNGPSDAGDGKNDFAYFLSMRGYVKKLYNKFTYERVNPNFQTLSGSAAADRERYQLNQRYTFSPQFTVRTDYTRYHDNLKKLSDTTTHTQIPSITFDIKPLKNNTKLNSTVTVRRTMRETTDCTTTDNARQVIENRWSYSLWKITFSLGGSYTWYTDRIDSSNDGVLDSRSISMRLNGYQWKDFVLSPSFSYSYNTEKHHSSDGREVFQNLNLGIRAKYKEVAFNCSFQVLDNDRDGDGDDNQRENINVSLEYRPKNRSNLFFAMSFKDRNNDYETTSRDYQERVGELECRISF